MRRKDSTTITLYALVDPRTSDIHYVGQSRRPQERYWAHLADVRKGIATERVRWMRTLSEFGLKPRLEVLDVTEDQSIADGRERMLIANGPDFGWPLTNILKGGEATWQEIGATRRGKPGQIPTAEHRAKIARSNMGHPVSEETKAKLRAASLSQTPPWLGRHLSAEHKAKIAAKAVGRKRSPEANEKIRQAMLRRPPMSLDTRAKLSAANLGKTMSPEAIEKMSIAKRGKTLTPEHRAKIGDRSRGRVFSESHRAGIGLAHRGRDFTEHEVVTVWCLLQEGYSCAGAARLAGVSDSTAIRIGKGTIWTDVTAALAAQLEN